jgi:hypothetical protein
MRSLDDACMHIDAPQLHAYTVLYSTCACILCMSACARARVRVQLVHTVLHCTAILYNTVLYVYTALHAYMNEKCCIFTVL